MRGWTSLLLTAIVATLMVVMVFALGLAQLTGADEVNGTITVAAGAFTFLAVLIFSAVRRSKHAVVREDGHISDTNS